MRIFENIKFESQIKDFPPVRLQSTGGRLLKSDHEKPPAVRTGGFSFHISVQ